MEMLEKIQKGMDLDHDEATVMFDEMLSGNVEESRMEALLVALSEKGETGEEIAAAAKVMTKYALPVHHTSTTLLDVVGTGGDGSGSFNISTAAAIVCSLFVPVAKHGNRAMSSKSGSADVLEALGVPIELDAQEASDFLAKNNFVFLFAQKYHPAMRSVAAVRKKLGRKTIFNLLGPLCNPARPDCQLIGLFSEDFMPRYMAAIEYLGIPNAEVVSSKDGLDEISISDRTTCYYKKGSSITKFDFDPKEFGIYADKETIQGYDAQTNAQIMKEVFRGVNHGDLTNAIAINAAFGLTLADVEADLRKAFLLAKETIKGGKAYEKLAELSS
jgi:anthranilate phosphoribosyltransferase